MSDNRIELKLRTKEFTGEVFRYTGELFLLQTRTFRKTDLHPDLARLTSSPSVTLAPQASPKIFQ